MAMLEARHANYRTVEDPPEDSGFHGLLDIYRLLPKDESDSTEIRWEYLRLVFVFGQLVSEAPISEDVVNSHDGYLGGSWLPRDPDQAMSWKLHSLKGLLESILGDPVFNAADRRSDKLALLKASENIEQVLDRLGRHTGY